MINSAIYKENAISKIRELYFYVFPKNVHKENLLFLFSISVLIFSKTLSILSLVIYKYAIELLLSPDKNTSLLFVEIIIIYSGMRLMGIVASELRDLFFTSFAQNIIKRIGIYVFEHIHGLSLRYHLDRRIGETSLSIEKGLKAIETLSVWTFFYIIPFLIEIGIMFLIILFFLSTSIALIIGGAILCYISFTIFVVTMRTKVRKEMNKQNSFLHSIIVESILNYETIKYFGSERQETLKLSRCLDNYKKAALDNTKGIAILNIGQNAILILSMTLTNILIGQMVYASTMTLGDLVLANMFILQVYTPLTSFGFMYREIKQSLIEIEKMMTLLKAKKEVQDTPNAKSLILSKNRISFQNVCFGYEKDYNILDNINFTLDKSKTIAFVGPSGSGKSTIVKLLYRFYDVNSGEIKIDGQDIKSVTQESLRKLIGVVPQQVTLFNETIYYNIAYGNPNSTYQDIEKVARMVQLHDFIISLSNGYETFVGEQGLKLSGGEKQRIAIARVLVKNPSTFVFDEATASLDYQNEKKIQKCIKEISKEKNCIIIAHRLSTISHADEIIFLEKGKIIEKGTHNSLLQNKGAYAALWQKQFDKNMYNEHK